MRPKDSTLQPPPPRGKGASGHQESELLASKSLLDPRGTVVAEVKRLRDENACLRETERAGDMEKRKSPPGARIEQTKSRIARLILALGNKSGD